MADVKKRVRSPNYPALGLASAVQQTEKLFGKIQTYAAPKEVVVTGLGYGSYNGASAVALSAQLKYGLVEKVGSDYKLTDRAMAILHPRNASEKGEALKAAAKAPTLFSELLEQFHGKAPNDDLLRSHLIRKGFAPSAITPLIHAFRETVELVSSDAAAYAGTVPGQGASHLSEPRAKVGDYVQWTSQGMDQFPIPQKVAWVSDDGNWLRIHGSQTGIAMNEVQVADRPRDGASDSDFMQDHDKSVGTDVAERRTKLKVLIDGDHLQVTAVIFDRKGIEKLIKTLNANKELLEEPQDEALEKS